MNSRVLHGDCMEVMEAFEDNSIDSLVTDGPYGLGFMGKSWDKFTSKEYQDFCFEWGSKALRVLKPGGYCLSFSAPRKYHRMVCGLEDAGFKIKDMINWVFGSGFPKSLDISLAINKLLGGVVKKGDMKIAPDGGRYDKRKKIGNPLTDYCYAGDIIEEEDHYEKIPSNSEALKWYGYGTGLKPAQEPIVLAQKPYKGTYAKNVLKWGVGGLYINGCRINYLNEGEDSRVYDESRNLTHGKHLNATIKYAPDGNAHRMFKPNKGRWPSNLILDEVSSEMIDYQSGDLERSGRPNLIGRHYNDSKWFNANLGGMFKANRQHMDRGGASRFFYCAKAHKSERNAGLDDLEDKPVPALQGNLDGCLNTKGIPSIAKNDIATLKPINLMRYLVRLVTPPNGTVLDPFAGSGTTGIACIIEGFNYVLIEKRERFAKVMIPKRLEYWKNPNNWDLLKEHSLLPEIKMKVTKIQNKSIKNWI